MTIGESKKKQKEFRNKFPLRFHRTANIGKCFIIVIFFFGELGLVKMTAMEI